jgi:hypothetical protein
MSLRLIWKLVQQNEDLIKQLLNEKAVEILVELSTAGIEPSKTLAATLVQKMAKNEK